MKVVRCLGFIGTIWLAGCAAQPVLDTSASAQRSFDGLYPFTHTGVDQAWARADLDLSGYKRVKLESAGIEYRPTTAAANSRLALTRAGETEFPLNEKQRQRLAEIFAEAFEAEMQNLKTLKVTEQEASDVLIVRGRLLDVVSKVPPEPLGRVDVYLESVGEATLVIEMIDAQSKSVLVRATDRREAENRGVPMPSNSVTNWMEVKRVAQSWARLLRIRLDSMMETMTLAEDAI